jgi:hypothetical protein
MNGVWWYEGVGFTWFGRLQDALEDTAGLEVLFQEIPGRSAKRILYTIGVPMYPRMKLRDVIAAPLEWDGMKRRRGLNTRRAGRSAPVLVVGPTLVEKAGDCLAG